MNHIDLVNNILKKLNTEAIFKLEDAAKLLAFDETLKILAEKELIPKDVIRDAKREMQRRFALKDGPKKREDAINQLLMMTELMLDSEFRGKGAKHDHNVPPSMFRKIFASTLPSISEKTIGGEAIFYMDGTLDALDGKLNFGFSSEVDIITGGFTIGASRQVPLSHCRGRVFRLGKTMIETVICCVSPINKEWITAKLYHAINGENIVNVSRRSNDSGGEQETFRDDFNEIVAVNIGAQFAMEYYWGVEIGIENGPSFIVPCSSDGVRSILKDRDIPFGKKNRQHLKNWVSEHLRLSQQKDEVLVRQHLRGRRECIWNGYRCRILPPLSQIREVEKKYGAETPVSVIDEGEIRRLESTHGIV
jgi:hypothetical protein